MNYIGDLYGKVNGKYIKLEMTSSDVDRLEKEKCELLGIIQQKDEIIKKMRHCENCKHRLKALEMVVMDLDKDESREPCNVCENYDKWEIRK